VAHEDYPVSRTGTEWTSFDPIDMGAHRNDKLSHSPIAAVSPPSGRPDLGRHVPDHISMARRKSVDSMVRAVEQPVAEPLRHEVDAVKDHRVHSSSAPQPEPGERHEIVSANEEIELLSDHPRPSDGPYDLL
jgi:hypothetical protein